MGTEMTSGAQGEDVAFEAWLAARAPIEPPSAAARRHARLAFLTEVAAAPLPLRARRSFRRLVLALAAAAILAVTFLLPEPERWRAQLDGRVVFDGDEYLPGDEARLAAALERSGTLETGARGRLELGDAFALALLAGGAMSVPPLPVLDGIEPLEFDLARGEAYLRTGPSYPGNPIVVRTDLADVTLHGTTVGVLVDAQGTCVCVADGTARVTSARLPAGFQDVGPRLTLRLYHDLGLDPRTEPFQAEGGVDAAHTADLVAFQRAP
jgi:ferric-dicitrate binding protein FerR (iron transport regulator)